MDRANAVVGTLARRRVLVASGLATAVLISALFGVFIPAIEAACGAPPPDVRPYTGPAQLRAFLEGCGPSGRAAYVRLQVVDLVYPAVMASFTIGALSALAARVAPSGRWSWVWVFPALSSAFDYVENIAAWVALARFPAAGELDGLLGVASAVKQGLGWAGGVTLVALLVALATPWARGQRARRGG